MKYLVKLRPLEPYAFGTDQGFEYPGEVKTGKESYFVRSKEFPEQTTILGLLRYLVLQQQGLLKTDFCYSPEEKVKMAECIGRDSFSFSEKDVVQDFGYIKSISPVFLINEKEEKLIKNPFHNKASVGYTPMKMEEGCETSAGTISLPAEGEFDSKEWYASGYYNLTTGEIIDGVFEVQIVSGNRKNEKNGSDEDCYFKRELITMKKEYSFAVYVEAKELPKKAIGYMGMKKSAFQIVTELVEDINLAEMVENAFKNSTEAWDYALSDILVDGALSYDEFCIVEEKHVRNLETVHSEENHLRKLKKSKVRYHMIQKGSVFYKKCNLNAENENCKKIGYNHLVHLGGN